MATHEDSPVFHLYDSSGWVRVQKAGTTRKRRLLLAADALLHAAAVAAAASAHRASLQQVNDPNGPLFYKGKYHM